MNHSRNVLRDVDLDGYRLRTWDTNKLSYERKWIVGYELSRPDGTVLFSGEDFACAPLHAVDSDACLRAILSFLTLRPGDTDPDYFESYTEEQLLFARNEAPALYVWAMDPSDEYEALPFVDWKGKK